MFNTLSVIYLKSTQPELHILFSDGTYAQSGGTFHHHIIKPVPDRIAQRWRYFATADKRPHTKIKFAPDGTWIYHRHFYHTKDGIQWT